MTSDQSWRTGGLEVSARAGVLLGAVAIGHSYQPNLLTRGTRDQALITGVAAASALGWGTTTNSFLRSVADRLPGATTPTGRIVTGVAVDAVAALAGAAVARSLPWAEHEPPRHAVLRLAAGSTAAAAAAGMAAHALETTRSRTWGRPVSVLAALAAGAGSYALSRPRRARAGSFMGEGVAAREDVTPRGLAAPGNRNGCRDDPRPARRRTRGVRAGTVFRAVRRRSWGVSPTTTAASGGSVPSAPSPPSGGSGSPPHRRAATGRGGAWRRTRRPRTSRRSRGAPPPTSPGPTSPARGVAG